MKISLFHAGPPKTATTWLYTCLKDHPQIVTSSRDAIHYFDMLYPKGENWYHNQFTTRTDKTKNRVMFDPTYSYICSPRAPERIYNYNPDAKIMVCLRNPVDRAFSHYWHQKKYFARDFFDFNEILIHYNHFATWMEHGFVAQGLERFLQYFRREQLYIMDFDQLKKDPAGEYKKILSFSELDISHTPPDLQKKVNIAGAKKDLLSLTMNRISKRIIGEDILSNSSHPSLQILSGKSEYSRGINSDLRRQLQEICEPEIVALERILAIDLSHWRHTTKIC